jgi:hypothetical protein
MAIWALAEMEISKLVVVDCTELVTAVEMILDFFRVLRFESAVLAVEGAHKLDIIGVTALGHRMHRATALTARW